MVTVRVSPCCFLAAAPSVARTMVLVCSTLLVLQGSTRWQASADEACIETARSDTDLKTGQDGQSLRDARPPSQCRLMREAGLCTSQPAVAAQCRRTCLACMSMPTAVSPTPTTSTTRTGTEIQLSVEQPPAVPTPAQSVATTLVITSSTATVATTAEGGVTATARAAQVNPLPPRAGPDGNVNATATGIQRPLRTPLSTPRTAPWTLVRSRSSPTEPTAPQIQTAASAASEEHVHDDGKTEPGQPWTQTVTQIMIGVVVLPDSVHYDPPRATSTAYSVATPTELDRNGIAVSLSTLDSDPDPNPDRRPRLSPAEAAAIATTLVAAFALLCAVAWARGCRCQCAEGRRAQRGSEGPAADTATHRAPETSAICDLWHKVCAFKFDQHSILRCPAHCFYCLHAAVAPRTPYVTPNSG